MGKRVREIRLARGVSQEKLGEQIGFDRTYVGDIERGECNLSLQSIEDLSERLGVRPLDLLADDID